MVNLIAGRTLFELAEVVSGCEDEVRSDEYARPIALGLLVEEHPHAVERKPLGLFWSDGGSPVVVVFAFVVVLFLLF
jgi:hypothetical protein